jgi:DNA-binding MarR family transcriptional regulator
MKSRRGRHAATTELLDEARALSSDFDKLSVAVANRIGLSPTDLLAMDLVVRRGKVSAGELARELHLTTGAITGLLDRLESAGFARRLADPDDRRRVLVEATGKERSVAKLFAPLAAALRREAERYSERDLATLTEFIRALRSVVSLTTDGVRRSR